MSLHQSALGLIAIVSLTGSCATVAGQSKYQSVVTSSFDVAGYVEHHRTLPESIEVQGESLTPSSWMQLGVATLLDISGIDTGPAPSGTWRMPADLYPEMILDEAVYGHALDRTEYLAFIQGLATTYGDGATLPSTFLLNGAEFRFVDAFLLVERLLRFYAAYGYLPSFADPKVSTPRGLFAWDIPTGKETFLSAIQNENGDPYSATNEYYRTSVLDFDMYQLAHEIVGGDTDPYEGGEDIYSWSLDRYNQSPYGVNYDVENLMGFVDDSYELIRYMQGTSGKPSGINRGLYVAAGLVHGYDYRGYGGALYTENEGWYNAEIHSRYGGDLSTNSFFLFSGDPSPQDPNAIAINAKATLFDQVRAATQLNSDPPEMRAFWVNPSDVTKWGADVLVETAEEGGFNAIVLTVKSFIGRLYFDTGQNDPIGWDALGPLVKAAAGHPDIEIYAAFNTLTDFEMNRADEWGQRYFEDVFGQSYNRFFMSPCIPDYVSYLKRLIEGLYHSYAVDGLVLARNYVHSDGWANPECGYDNTTDDRTKRDRIAAFANDLAAHAKGLAPDRKVFYMTAPLIGNSGIDLGVYSHDASPSMLDTTDFDGVILTLQGLAWLTPENESYPLLSREVWNGYMADYKEATTLPLHAMIHLSKDWMYGPSFYRGLARDYRSRGLDGVFITAENSAEGEFGPAFVTQHMAKLSRIRFDDPPPEQEVLTSTEAEIPHQPRLALDAPYPNPTRGPLRLGFELPEAGDVTISIYDALGRLVTTLEERVFTGGRHELTVAPAELAGGMYFVRLEGPSATVSRPFVVR